MFSVIIILRELKCCDVSLPVSVPVSVPVKLKCMSNYSDNFNKNMTFGEDIPFCFIN
jgi:hypothetical protein